MKLNASTAAVLIALMLCGCAWQRAHSPRQNAYWWEREDFCAEETLNDYRWRVHVSGYDYAEHWSRYEQ